jgi:cytochrome c oxidase cbb3-type subunit 3
MSTTDPHQEEHADGIVEDREKAPPVYFNILFFGLIIWGVAFMAFYLLSGWSSDKEFQEKMDAHKGEPQVQQQEVTSAPATAVKVAVEKEAEAASGQELYAKYCASCHGADGTGGFGPDLSGEYKYGKTIAAVKESISQGRPKNMPAFEDRLSAEEIESLTSYILSL